MELEASVTIPGLPVLIGEVVTEEVLSQPLIAGFEIGHPVSVHIDLERTGLSPPPPKGKSTYHRVLYRLHSEQMGDVQSCEYAGSEKQERKDLSSMGGTGTAHGP